MQVDEGLIAALLEAAERPDVASATRGGWTAGELLAFPRVVTVAECSVAGETDTASDAVREAVEDAIAELDTMRQAEGEHLAADLDQRLVAFAGLVDRIAAAATAGEAALRARLTDRVLEFAPDVANDPSVVAQESGPVCGALRHRGKSLRGCARTWRTGGRSPAARSRAAASSISCCRR